MNGREWMKLSKLRRRKQRAESREEDVRKKKRKRARMQEAGMQIERKIGIRFDKAK